MLAAPAGPVVDLVEGARVAVRGPRGGPASWYRTVMRCPPQRPQRSSPDSSAEPSRGAPGVAAVCRLAAIRATFASYSSGVM